jgi:hypothetical protein
VPKGIRTGLFESCKSISGVAKSRENYIGYSGCVVVPEVIANVAAQHGGQIECATRPTHISDFSNYGGSAFNTGWHAVGDESGHGGY